VGRAARLGVAVVLGVMCLSGVVSVTTAGVASAAPEVANLQLKGLTVVEADFSVPAHSQSYSYAKCPGGHWVVGGGGYQVTQGLGEDIAESYPYSKVSWEVWFNNENSYNETVVAVAICATVKSLSDYSLQQGAEVTVPAGGEAQATVTCPSGTVALGGGAAVGDQTYQALDASAPYGTNGWRAYVGSAGSQEALGEADVVCAAEPTGWAQVNSAYVPNPAGTATTVSVNCPAGTKAIGGGPFNGSADPTVTVGLTTPLSGLTGWHSWEDNASTASESVDEWAVCAKATGS
jgi:hypothetical protein